MCQNLFLARYLFCRLWLRYGRDNFSIRLEFNQLAITFRYAGFDRPLVTYLGCCGSLIRILCNNGNLFLICCIAFVFVTQPVKNAIKLRHRQCYQCRASQTNNNRTVRDPGFLARSICLEGFIKFALEFLHGSASPPHQVK